MIKNQSGAVPVLDSGVMDDDIHKQTERIDRDVVLDTFDFLAGIVADRVEADPPFSAPRTL